MSTPPERAHAASGKPGQESPRRGGVQAKHPELRDVGGSFLKKGFRRVQPRTSRSGTPTTSAKSRLFHSGGGGSYPGRGTNGFAGMASEWIADRAETADLTPGYFGASTGAGAALTAASLPDSRIAAKRSPRRICERRTRRTASSPGLLLPYLSARRRERVTKLRCQYRATTGAGPP